MEINYERIYCHLFSVHIYTGRALAAIRWRYSHNKKRPFIIKAYHLMLFLLLCFMPGILMPFIRLSHTISRLGGKTYMLLLLPLLYIIVLVFFKFLIKGYFIFGVTKDSFRNPLRQSLKNLDMEFEETIYGIELKNYNILIQSNIQTQAGTAQLFCKDNNPQPLDSIISELKKIYAEEKVDMNYLCSIFYCILAFMMFAFSLIILLNH